VTWDGSKGGSSKEQEEEKKRRQGVFFFFLERRIGRIRGICGRKPQTLF